MTASDGVEIEENPDLSLQTTEEPRRGGRTAPAPVRPADLLPVRRRLAQRVFGATPNAQRLCEHAEKYGIDGIAETGAEAGMDEESLTALIVSLDRINATMRRDPRRKHLFRVPPKMSAPRRARELLGISEGPEKI